MRPHLVIIGSGPAGYVGALHAAMHGARVTLVERQAIGGTCLQRGCIPTKTLVASGALLERMRRAEQYGIRIEGRVSASWPGIQARVQRVVKTIADGLNALLAQRAIELRLGTAALASPRSVRVDGDAIACDAVLLCTGSRPSRPAAFDFDGSRVVTSDEALAWPDLPGSLVIVGEGIVACELAFVYRALGVDVTVIGMEDRPLPSEDADISRVLLREMRKRGIRFLGGAGIERVGTTAEGVACWRDGQAVATAERALVAVGRRAETAGLGLDEIGVRTGRRGEIEVDEHMRTGVPGIYAAGDVTGRLMLAHAASAQAVVAVDHLLGRPTGGLVACAIPRAIFTDPEVACVGSSEQAARARGLEVRCGSFDFRALGKAQAMGELAGTVKVVAEAQTGRLLGVHMIGAHVTEMIHEAASALARGAGVEELMRTVHAHPTLSEALAEAAADVFGAAPHKVRATN